jgi:hypothetical protein
MLSIRFVKTFTLSSGNDNSSNSANDSSTSHLILLFFGTNAKISILLISYSLIQTDMTVSGFDKLSNMESNKSFCF